MRIYIAASVSNKARALEIADLLQSSGHEIVSEWLTLPNVDQKPDQLVKAGHAVVNIGNIAECDVFVFLTGVESSTGGMHTEFGLALAWFKKCILYGPARSVFQNLVRPEFQVQSAEALIRVIGNLVASPRTQTFVPDLGELPR